LAKNSSIIFLAVPFTSRCPNRAIGASPTIRMAVVTAAPNVIADAVRAQTLTGSGGSNVFVFNNLGFGHATGLSAAS
jgi:hypothetical protein